MNFNFTLVLFYRGTDIHRFRLYILILLSTVPCLCGGGLVAASSDVVDKIQKIIDISNRLD